MLFYVIVGIVVGLSFSLLLLLPFFNTCIEGYPAVFAVLPLNERGIVVHKAIVLTVASSTLVISEYK